MKKWLIIPAVLSLSSCTYLTCLDNFDGAVLPQCQKQQQQQPQEITSIDQVPEENRRIPKFKIEGEKDGPYITKAGNGRTLKTILKNGYFDQYVDIYHPNGKLHSHTPVKMGVPEGWSTGYTEQGKLRTKALYEKGRIIRAQLYNEKGEMIKELK
ncbi:toxin-antitoxin system YwqK family antitoxin [Avibacterium volantium]|uniref:MORN repeat variant n=1 Tax=Avibacterium volantium TaxID=762 RepID=A0A447SN48_AVIVO|nr:hypothetical protein [Avibacterium volantium]VEB21915.1 Uncharacterised protein [Avibacterium volantium]